MIYRRVNVKEKIRENDKTFTLLFDYELNVLPGQFAMVWLPNIDEFPMSFSYIGNFKGFTFKVIGEGTEKLSHLEKGDQFFIRGPYGSGYREKGNSALYIAGGTGISSLAPFIESSHFKRKVVVIGARSRNDLYFIERISKNADELIIFTEDGSYGLKGVVTDALSDNFDSVYACGPEKMIRKIVDFYRFKNIELQASLERIMKCGIGICDSCTINGYRVCVDGPVFEKGDLINMNDLGIVGRLPSGRRIKI